MTEKYLRKAVVRPMGIRRGPGEEKAWNEIKAACEKWGLGMVIAMGDELGFVS